MEPHYDVFLSHSSLDDELASDVEDILKLNGITVFATPGSIISGKWEPQIEEALQNSDHIWVLLTPNALSHSVWVHHELGYFYGFRHGRGEDSLGSRSHYVYEEDTPKPGLYAQLQGVPVETLGDPLVVATTIAETLGRDLKPPTDWQGRKHEIRPAIPDASEEFFREELSDLQIELLSTIQTRGYWKVVIRPEKYIKLRIPDISQMQSIVDKCRIRLSGWEFPSIANQANTQRDMQR